MCEKGDAGDKTVTEAPVDKALLEQLICSPCISVCVVDEPTGFCKGCWRTVDEIAQWPRMMRHQRLEILGRLAERRGATSLTDRGRGPMLAAD
ncbi:MAG TPA: DUF1289 domain-containing protein [Rhodospirillaceae bacterium]|nr:DUF1289 domain-containing protein [Magnetovibrio sp.]HBT41267.1 DUF1289 domain-containing protein [Rhodospirillaceae bacterium]HCS72189.1 DUF1289 domain-containing protein [Rhodospirillaceae bacterium]|tara:strand:- start:986 stop:1264 length:279 start_codon:yes stop_codon:yes gene_type:complete